MQQYHIPAHHTDTKLGPGGRSLDHLSLCFKGIIKPQPLPLSLLFPSYEQSLSICCQGRIKGQGRDACLEKLASRVLATQRAISARSPAAKCPDPESAACGGQGN